MTGFGRFHKGADRTALIGYPTSAPEGRVEEGSEHSHHDDKGGGYTDQTQVGDSVASEFKSVGHLVFLCWL
jgi:hypothetical protein